MTSEGNSIAVEDHLRSLRVDAAERGKWNIGFFAAGLVFWCGAAIVGAQLPLETARIYWFAGTFLIFPLAVLFSRLCKADPFTKGNALGDLVGYTHMSVIALTTPLIFAVLLYHPEMLLLAMAILYCIDFYVMSWAFGTPLFGVHAALRTAAVSLIWFAAPEWRSTVLPAVVALFYLGTLILSPMLRRRWLATHASPA